MDKNIDLWIVKRGKSYGIYDNHDLAIATAIKYKAEIHKIELNKFKFHYAGDPFPLRDLTLKKI